MLLFLSVLKAFSEILVFSLLGQGALWLVAGKSRDTNFVYRMFATVTRPLMKLARLVAPRFVLDRHVWLVAVFIVLAVLIVTSHQKLELCLTESAADPLCVEIQRGLEERRQSKGG